MYNIVELSELEERKPTAEYNLAYIKNKLERVNFQLMPQGGWSGKNESERQYNQKLAQESSQEYLSLLSELQSAELEYAQLIGRLEAIRAERRYIEMIFAYRSTTDDRRPGRRNRNY